MPDTPGTSRQCFRVENMKESYICEEGLDMCFAGNKLEVPERQCSNLEAI